ncbi:MAG: outer membrane beta-barrel protein [Candidatus Latescibacteria bacterium]|nr:outer membrane beta-barrel protein [Candidatus Latescibacterota bacterium]NIO01017.1 outer membrane beta-barrel protein [Candidatus Latescibacterota bacterium]NIO27416.1 outer membrane beta-barrel protein [Candidatus Latescibacterota bacterium]NIO54938.1 outer membrane beta-barrel protein [Candidatus Latescibacterota bacterium]NIT01027.1 outer membrane beta-barrel protein [Candidatus Latescibacterota bacterium]
MKKNQVLGLATALALLGVSSASSGPILKPRKYHGPIPRSSFSLRVGFHGGASNEEMWSKLDAMVLERSGQVFTDDFSNAFILDGTYTYKLHPQFAIRANGSLTFLRSESRGFFVPALDPAPPILPVYHFARRFNVDLAMLEGSGVYYFTDAGVNEFQPYIGAGFSAGFPHATFQEGIVDPDSNIVITDDNDTEWSLEAGVHGLLGAMYYISSSIAINLETRYQIAQSKFPLMIETPGGPRQVRFDVDYTGFVLNVGAVWAF